MRPLNGFGSSLWSKFGIMGCLEIQISYEFPLLLTPTPTTYGLCASRFVYRKLSSTRNLIPQAGPTTNPIIPMYLGPAPPVGGSQLILPQKKIPHRGTSIFAYSAYALRRPYF